MLQSTDQFKNFRRPTYAKVIIEDSFVARNFFRQLLSIFHFLQMHFKSSLKKNHVSPCNDQNTPTSVTMKMHVKYYSSNFLNL